MRAMRVMPRLPENFDPDTVVISGKYRLTDSQKLFIMHYVGDCLLNEREAALAAGYTCVGGLMANKNIRACIDEILDRNTMTQAEILHRLTQIAKGTYTKLLGSDGKIDTRQLDRPDVAPIIKDVTSFERFDKQGNLVGIKTSVSMYSAMDAIQLLMKSKGMLTDRTEHTVNVDMQVLNVLIESLPLDQRPAVLAAIEAALAPGGAEGDTKQIQAYTPHSEGFEDNGFEGEPDTVDVESYSEGTDEGTGS